MELAERWGEQPLTAVGVMAAFALVRATDVVLDPDEMEPREGDFAEPDDVGLLDAVDVWCEDILDALPETPVPPVVTELVAVRDLDLVDDDAWPQVLAMLSQPPLRDALTAPVRVLLPDGTTESVRPYTAWWLRGHPVLDGRRPAGLRSAGGDPLLAGLYESADAGDVDAQVLRALGVRTSVAALLDEPGGAAELLTRLADPDLTVGAAQLHALYGLLADLDPDQVTLPDELRTVLDQQIRVVDAADAVVADAPDLVPLAAGHALLGTPGPRRCPGRAAPGTAPERGGQRRGALRGRPPRGPRGRPRPARPRHPRHVPGTRGTPRRRRPGRHRRTGLAPHPRRHPPRRHPGGRRGGPGLGGRPVAAPLRGRGPAGGPGAGDELARARWFD